ncbi:Fic family protein [Novosphingobium sp.]|uniref:Fic family protein n=1 Tax=Novosphingobium sp. TaxID=1874826 RepID=UPI002615A5C4|nr:Fic family protein [Novosphingobium sp.]
MTDRHTISQEADFIQDELERAALEAENTLLQFDEVLDLIDETLRDGRPFRLRPSTILGLHRTAMQRVHPQAGTFRNAGVEIGGSRHAPPHEGLVPAKVEDLCEWINRHWADKSALELCAYVMWRLNWIHPFADGNGRTTRAVAYLVLCVKAGARLPGWPTIPEQIAVDKAPYYDALEAADLAAQDEETDLSAMMELLEGYLQKQLAAVLEAATSTEPLAGQRKFH